MFLCPIFEDRIINRTADVVWPPRSCALKDNIREAIAEIQLHTIGNMLKNLKKRGGYWEHLVSMFLRPIFEDRVISRSADVVRPPWSCDLTTLDYYL